MDDYYENDEDEYNPFEIKYGAEVKAFERTHAGRPDVILSKLFGEGKINIGGLNLEEVYKKLFRNIAPEERFKQTVNFYVNNLRESLRLTDSHLDVLLDIDRFKNIKYKNPLCYILGFWVVNKSTKTIDTEKMNAVITKIIPDLNESIAPEDVLRYARFWLKN